MNVDWERQASCLSGPLDHTSYAHPTEWLSSLVDEEICRCDFAGRILTLQSLKASNLITFEIVSGIVAALDASHQDGALRQIDVIPAQIAGLTDAETMSVDQKPNQ